MSTIAPLVATMMAPSKPLPEERPSELNGNPLSKAPSTLLFTATDVGATEDTFAAYIQRYDQRAITQRSDARISAARNYK